MEEILIDVHEPELKRRICACMDVQQALQWQTEDLLQQCGEGVPELHPVSLLQERIWVRLRMALQPSCASAADLLTDHSRRILRRLHREQNHTPDAAMPVQQLAENICRSEKILTDSIKSYL